MANEYTGYWDLGHPGDGREQPVIREGHPPERGTGYWVAPEDMPLANTIYDGNLVRFRAVKPKTGNPRHWQNAVDIRPLRKS